MMVSGWKTIPSVWLLELVLGFAKTMDTCPAGTLEGRELYIRRVSEVASLLGQVVDMCSGDVRIAKRVRQERAGAGMRVQNCECSGDGGSLQCVPRGYSLFTFPKHKFPFLYRGKLAAAHGETEYSTKVCSSTVWVTIPRKYTLIPFSLRQCLKRH